jgi:cytochrome P450 family 6
MILPIILSILIICLSLIVRRHYDHWKNRGIPFIKPKFPFGNIECVLKKEKAFGVAIYDLYKELDQPFVGIFLLFRRALLIREKNLVKNILTNDFDYFHDRGVYCNAKGDPISANLFTLPGDKWRPLRNKITPAFTSVKLKSMFPHIKFVADSLVKYLEPMAEKGEVIEIFEFTHRFVVDCLASVAFGQEGISTINDPNHDFAMIPKMGNNQSFSTAIRNAGFLAFPG